MTWIAGLTAVFVFALVLDRSGVGSAAVRALDTSRGAAQLMRNPALDDRAREAAMRRASKSLMGAFVGLAARGLAAAAASVGVLGGFHLAGLVDFDAATRWLATVPALLAATALVTVWVLLRRRT